MSRFSIVEYIGPSERVSCGYCGYDGKQRKVSLGEGAKEDSGSVCLGAWAHVVGTSDYLSLLNSGWRRSGAYLYKPTMARTCCPQYTIRLDVHKFTPSRTQKKVLRNMELFLRTGEKPKQKKETEGIAAGDAGDIRGGRRKEKREAGEKKSEQQVERGMKKKEIRRQRALERWKRQGVDVKQRLAERRERESRRSKSLQERLGQTALPHFVHSLQVEVVAVRSEEYNERSDESFALFEKYQQTIHNDERVTRSGYDRFLVRSPLLASRDGVLGSFHHRYLLDGKLIAVGVVDVLPGCLSSKYIFYDPDFSFLTLGTYTALREIAEVQRLSVARPELHFYYMGYYIASCPKMRYKGRFRPSELLCDYSFKWVELKECLSMLSSNGGGFTVFCPSEERAPRMPPLDARVLFRRSAVFVRNLPDTEREKIISDLSSIADCIAAPLPSQPNSLLFCFKQFHSSDSDDEDDAEVSA